MAHGPYRDAGSHEYVARLRAEALERRSRLLPAFWRSAPAPLVQLLVELEKAIPADDPRNTDHTAVVVALETYRAALDDAIAAASGSEGRAWTEPGERPAHRIIPASLESRERTPSVLLEESLQLDEQRQGSRRFESAQLERVAAREYASFLCRGVPFAATASAAPGHTSVAAAVPRGAPILSVRGEEWVDDVLQSIGMRKSMTVGDSSFDKAFVVRGDEDAAGLLSGDVREALLRIAERARPEVVVREGIARISFAWEPWIELLDAAVDALLGIRDAPCARRLVK